MSPRSCLPGPIGLVSIAIAVVSSLSQYSIADTQVPASVAGLLPPGVKVQSQDWSVYRGEEEFEGVTFGGQMDALFTGSVSCDYTVGPSLNLELKGQTAWEASPEQLEMFAQMSTPDFAAQARDMPGQLTTSLNAAQYGIVVGESHSEELANGHIVYTEFTWKCDKNPEGKNVKLQGFARRGATILELGFWANGDGAKAREIAAGVFDRFGKLDIKALTQ